MRIIKASSALDTITGLDSMIYEYFKDVSKYYPNFNDWYFNKIITQVYNHSEREILIHLNENNIITGGAIIKNTYDEKKICTLKVVDKNNGIAQKLIEESFINLDTRNPIMTISEDKVNQFKYLLSKYNSKKILELKDCYVQGKTEYIYIF